MQEMLVTMANNMQALLPGGLAFYNYGDTQPAPEYQAYPWLRSTDMRWYRFTGIWISPHPMTAGEHRWEEFAAVANIWSFDGGDGSDPSVTPPGPSSGAMWEEDTAYRGRSPMGPGSVPGLTTPYTLAPETDYGSGEHTLTEAEGATGLHVHGLGHAQTGNNDGYFLRQGQIAVAAWNGYGVIGSGSSEVIAALTDVNLFTWPTGATAAGVTSTPFGIVHPVRGMYCIKRTARQNYRA